MVKYKRARQKYHKACVKAREKEEEEKKQQKDDVEKEKNEDSGQEMKEMMEVDASSVAGGEDDAKSVRTMRSVSKSYKSIKKSVGSTMSKADKRKLRHDLFLTKVQMNHEMLKASKKGKNSSLPETVDDLNRLLPFANMLHHETPKPKKEKIKQPPPVSQKIKGIKKAKERKKEMENNLEAFKSLMANPTFKKAPLDCVTESIQDKVFNQIV